MSWQAELTFVVRTLINDLNEPYEFSDSRIQQIIPVAGKYVQFDVNLDYEYTIDVINQNISPDPIERKDELFVSLICLKAACMIDQGTFRTKAALEGIRTQLGPASIGFSGGISGYRDIIDHGACGLYTEFVNTWDVRNANGCRAVLGPFVGNKFDPSYLFRGFLRENNGSLYQQPFKRQKKQ